MGESVKNKETNREWIRWATEKIKALEDDVRKLKRKLAGHKDIAEKLRAEREGMVPVGRQQIINIFLDGYQWHTTVEVRKILGEDVANLNDKVGHYVDTMLSAHQQQGER